MKKPQNDIMNIQNRHMHRFLTLIGIIAALLVVSVVGAFYDEGVVLKAELEQWQKNNRADFSDIVSRLEDFSAPVFRDVSEDDWYNPYISSLAEWNIVSGYKDTSGQPTGEFHPGDPVTVAEILKMSLEAAQVEKGGCVQQPANPYAQNHWAGIYVACAEEMGVRLMVPTQQTPLDRSARRAEVLSIIHDAFGIRVLPLFSNYSDTAGHPLEADIAYATVNGVVGGDTDQYGNPTGAFRPDDPVNRAEAAKIIYESLRRQEMNTNIASL